MSRLMLRLKAAESFLETSQCTYEYNSVQVHKIRISRCEMRKFYLVLAKIRIKKSG